MTVEEIESLEPFAEEQSLFSELALARLQLRRMVGYQMQEDVPVEQKAKMASMIFTGIRAVAYVQRQIEETEEEVDWNETLDELGEAWDWDI